MGWGVKKGICKDYFDTNPILICIALLYFEITRQFSECRWSSTGVQWRGAAVIRVKVIGWISDL